MEVSSAVSIAYFSSYLLLLLALIIHLYRTEQNLNKKKFAKAIWSKKAIYGAVLVHLYDIATDLGVLIEWFYLARKVANGAEPYKTINITIFWFFLSFFFILHRVGTTVFAVSSAWSDGKRYSIIFYLLLGIFDLYLIKEVIESIKRNETEPGSRQKSIQLAECLLESLPQTVLQSIFIILSYNDERLRNDSSMLLVLFSLIASILSICNKYLWFDRSGAHPKAREVNIQSKMYCYCLSETSPDDMVTVSVVCVIHKTELELCDQLSSVTDNDECWFCAVVQKDSFYKCDAADCQYVVCLDCYELYKYQHHKNECVNLYYLLRFVWRFSFICIRFICLSLTWVVLGGAFLAIFLLWSSINWCVVYWFAVSRHIFEFYPEYDEPLCVSCCLLSMISLIANPPSSKYEVAIYHWIEMTLCMLLITLFSLNQEMDCIICADVYYRQTTNNLYVELFVILGWIMLFIDFITYFALLWNAGFVKEAEIGAFAGIASGFDSLRDDGTKNTITATDNIIL